MYIKLNFHQLFRSGIGSIPDAVLSCLKNHKDLGVHSEMISDGVVDLAESGCLSNSRKKVFPGKIVSSFCLGSRRLYDFLDNNPSVGRMPLNYICKLI